MFQQRVEVSLDDWVLLLQPASQRRDGWFVVEARLLGIAICHEELAGMTVSSLQHSSIHPLHVLWF